MTFTHLNVASSFSSHYGTNRPQELVAAAAADEMRALAITDRDGLYGAVKHIGACVDLGVAPILGVSLAVEERGRAVVLASGATGGYAALCQLISRAHERPQGESARVSLQDLAEFAAPAAGEVRRRLFVLAGPESEIGEAAASRDYRSTRALLRQWREVLGEALRVEVVSHLAPPGEALSTAHAVRMLSAAQVSRVAPVLTNAVRLLSTDEAATADVLDAVRVLSDLHHTAALQPTDQGWLKPAAQMEALAAEICAASTTSTSAEELLENTARLARQCELDPVTDMGWGQPKVPEATVIGIEGDPDEELRARCEAGLAEMLAAEEQTSADQGSGADSRSGTAQENTARERAGTARARLEHELSIIADLGFAPYFLTVAEVARLIREMGVRAAARGSAVSSLVVHALGISPIDPLQHGLIFERFLSRRRSTLPDIDIDVESAERHRIYRAVFKRFGSQRVTLMSMQNAYRIRGAVRDAGLALGLPEEEIDQLAEIMWRFPAREFRRALEEKPELRSLAERIETERTSGRQQLDLLVDLSERLDRLPRHISTHPCGVILGNNNLLKLTPVERSGVNGLPMSQFDKDDMDPMGFIKLDVLGVRMQSAIAYALTELQRTTGEVIDMVKDVDYADPATFAMIQSTHTLGCFQIESPGQRELIGKLVPETLNDLVVDISLFRPGPMGSGMVKPYLERRHGYEEVGYPHPDLAPILDETYGVVVFHEQVLRIFDTMTDCGLDVADELRRAMSKDKSGPVEIFFREETAKRNYSAAVIDRVWEILLSFGSFGFCKAHGAAFAVPTYQSAWLKTHHPAHFLCGLFEHDPGMYPLRLLVSEARRLGIPLLPMDVNRSTSSYHVEATSVAGLPVWGIRMSLNGLKGISKTELRRIEAEQPFSSLADLRDRPRLKRSTLRDLVKVGALDCLLPEGRKGRKDLIQWVESTNLEFGKKPPARQVQGQLSLPIEDVEIANMPTGAGELQAREIVTTELDLTSLDTSGHVMEIHRPVLEAAGATFAEQLLSLRNGATVRVAGIRVATQTPPMASGKRVVFITLDDGTGCVDLSFFEEAQYNTGECLFAAKVLMAEGTIRRTGPRAVTVQATRAWDLRGETVPGQLPAAAGSA
ncbi:DNA polymerase III subunit alpha [Nesterenkonia halotolerans]|uniref:DNA polymerase III subunit alpha n=1 Tax=Nesterenkonia halotolerans TaxID=225325 RepID=A0ABR9J3V9_9MICC|nr:DNA polymerase III subunit alpha [Nesterenkonia halotolerans]MBE1513698.1 error-prone DNA polymerase [Nesterenkonia halotolerans]